MTDTNEYDDLVLKHEALRKKYDILLETFQHITTWLHDPEVVLQEYRRVIKPEHRNEISMLQFIRVFVFK
jgi:hypothetical protein